MAHTRALALAAEGSTCRMSHWSDHDLAAGSCGSHVCSKVDNIAAHFVRTVMTVNMSMMCRYTVDIHLGHLQV